MKQHFSLLVSGFLACTLPLGAQTWLAPDGILTYHLTGGFIGIDDYFNLQPGPDTVINGQTCRKMVVSGAPFNYPQSRFAYADGDRVYAYQENNNTFVKLYDFTLAPGAVVSMPVYQANGFFQYRIEAVDTVQAGSFILRRQQAVHLNASGNPSGWAFDILEGMGMVGLPFSTGMEACSYFFPDEAPLCASVVDGFDIKFSCYRAPGGVYSPFGLDCASVPTHALVPAGALTLSPNPTVDVVTLQAVDLPAAVVHTRVFDTSGQYWQVYPGLPDRLDTVSWPAGLYAVVIELENGGRITHRFVRL